jgi:hypothetical protein
MDWLRRMIFLLAPDGDGGGGADTPAPEKKEDPPKPKGAKFMSQLSRPMVEKYRAELESYEGGIGELWEEAVTAKKKLARSITVPDKDNPDPEERKAFFKAFGIPDKSDEYGLEAKSAEKNFMAARAQKYHALAARKAQAEAFEPAILKKVDGDATKKDEAINIYKRVWSMRAKNPALVKRLADSGMLMDPDFAMLIVDMESGRNEEEFVDGGRRQRDPAPKKQQRFSKQWTEMYGGAK